MPPAGEHGGGRAPKSRWGKLRDAIKPEMQLNKI